MAFTDELATGVVPSGAPELLDAFSLTPARAAGWTLFAFGLLGALLEPPLLALAQGPRERALRVGGLALMGLTTVGAALAPSCAWLLLALALYGPASGLGTQLAEAALLAQSPGRAERVLARWALLGGLGDLLAPVALAVSVALGLGWRGALVAVGLFTLTQAAAAWSARSAAAEEDTEEAEAPLREALCTALRCPPLLGWSLAAVLCSLMDEVLIAFGALFLAERLGADAAGRAAILSAGVLGELLGALLLERVAHRFRSSVLLAMSGAGCALAYAAWLGADTVLTSAVGLAVAGLFAAMHHPLLRARAFAALPGRPNVVLATGSLFSGLELAVPLLVGVVADRAGTLAAMLVLLAQPLGVLVAAVASVPSPPGRGKG